MVAQIRHIGLACGEANTSVADFYASAFGMTEVNVTSHHRERSGVYLSDGHINLACLMAPASTVGKLHFGFQVDDIEATFEAAEQFQGRIGDRARPKDGRYAEAGVFDPVGTSIDLTSEGWRQRDPADEGQPPPVIQHIGLATGEAVEEVATFYKEVFGMVEVNVTSHHRERSGIYLSDGNVNLACLMAPSAPVGQLHFGFKVDDIDEILATVEEAGGTVGDRERPKDGRFAEAGIVDPVGTGVDLSTAGWRLLPQQFVAIPEIVR